MNHNKYRPSMLPGTERLPTLLPVNKLVELGQLERIVKNLNRRFETDAMLELIAAVLVFIPFKFHA